MAGPTYATDLNDFEDFEAASTISTELTGYTDTSKGDDEDGDFPIQGTQHASAEQRTAATGSLASDYGSNITWTSGWNFFMWGMFLAPAAVNSFANGGIEMAVGSAITAFHRWTVGGNDFGRYPYGGWQNFVVNPEVTTGRTTTGAPGTNYRWVGMLCDVISAITKGSPYGVDVIRYGRGEISAINGETADYATFDGMATENDYNDATNGYHRWGLFSLQSGIYLWKGLMSLGLTATAVDFRDENRSIVIDNSINVISTFNKIEVNHASSNIEWTNISITSLCTVSPGQFEMIADATLVFDTCQFTDMDTFIFDSNSSLLVTTFRRCGLVTAAGASFDECTFEEGTDTSALIVTSPADAEEVTDCNFISSGTGHGLEITGTAASFELTGCVFEGYDTANPGTAANKAIYVNIATGTVNLTITGGTGVTQDYHVRSAGATVNVIVGAVTVQATVVLADGTPVEDARVFIRASDGTGPFPYQETVTIVNSGTTATVTHTGHGMASNDKVSIKGASLGANNGTYQITVSGVDTYTYTMLSTPGSSPTGTIKATFVALQGLTSALGVLSTTRVYASDQPIEGWARKSTSTPFYKQGPITGAVDSADGLPAVAVLVLDE